jgi:hypothetical protein
VLENLVDRGQDPSETPPADEQLLQHSVAERTKDLTSTIVSKVEDFYKSQICPALLSGN